MGWFERRVERYRLHTPSEPGVKKGAGGVFAAGSPEKELLFARAASVGRDPESRRAFHGDGNPKRTRSAISPLPVGTVGTVAAEKGDSLNATRAYRRYPSPRSTQQGIANPFRVPSAGLARGLENRSLLPGAQPDSDKLAPVVTLCDLRPSHLCHALDFT